jgi:hypothetical protein
VAGLGCEGAVGVGDRHGLVGLRFLANRSGVELVGPSRGSTDRPGLAVPGPWETRPGPTMRR